VVNLFDVKFTKSRQAVASSHVDRGFSHIELLVLAGIVATLAAIALVAVRGVAVNGLETACAQDRRVVSIAIESYFAEHHVDRLRELRSTDSDEFDRILVSEGVINHVSAFYDLTADGSLVPETGSPCA